MAKQAAELDQMQKNSFLPPQREREEDHLVPERERRRDEKSEVTVIGANTNQHTSDRSRRRTQLGISVINCSFEDMRLFVVVKYSRKKYLYS